MIFKSFNSKAAEILKNGGIGIIPTDTIYGIVGSALKENVVGKIYKLRKRNLRKPMIILIGQISDLKKFGINLQPSARGGSSFRGKTYNLTTNNWPPKTSILLPCPIAKFKYLHRGAKSLAFRLPKDKKLKAFLKRTGPLVAPSANIEGRPPARTILEAQKYFGNKVDFYITPRRLNFQPSKLIQIKDGKIKELRK